jgi:hypothetical protein
MKVEYKYKEACHEWREHIEKFVNGIPVSYYLLDIDQHEREWMPEETINKMPSYYTKTLTEAEVFEICL